MDKAGLIERFAAKGFLLHPELLQKLQNEETATITMFLNIIEKEAKHPILTSQTLFSFLNSLKEREKIIEVSEDEALAVEPKVKITTQISALEEGEETFEEKIEKREQKGEEELVSKTNSIKILFSFSEEPLKPEVENFVTYFRNRLARLSEILSKRPELEKLTSINKISRERQQLSVIGMINDKRVTKQGNVFLLLEDLTGSLRVIVSKYNKELFNRADSFTFDEVVGIRGRGNNEFLFAEEIVQPGFLKNEKKKDGKGFALFISDLHIGSKLFLDKQFNNFVRWLNLETNGKSK